MKLDLLCPACGAELEADTEIGSAIVCPGCGHPFAAVPRVPSPPPAPPSPRPAASAEPSAPLRLAGPSLALVRCYYWNALLALVLFAPVGLVAVAFACLARGARSAGDEPRLRVYSGAALAACNAAFICFLVGLVFWLGGCVLVSALGHAASTALRAP